MHATPHTAPHSSTARVLVFDSGVGGLSILQEIRQQYPDCLYFYASDNAAFPYGIKSEHELVERVDHVVHQLQDMTQADIIVIACNTASTVALPRIRERFSQPIIGVVPAIKPAAMISQSKVIGLLATPGTIERDYTQQLIDTFASDCHIVPVGSSELVILAEKKLRGELIAPEQLQHIVEPLAQHSEMDTLVLACTHFPLLKDELRTALPHIHHWVDSGEAIARRVGYWLNQLGGLPLIQQEKAAITQANTALFTSASSSIDELDTALHTFGLEHTIVLPSAEAKQMPHDSVDTQ